MQTVRSFVGMDVHKETISISIAEDGRSGPVRFLGVIPNQPDDIAKMAKRLAKHGKLDFCYEASGCGYNIHRQLTGLGHVRELESVIDNPDAEPVMPCNAAKPAIVVYGKQLGRKLTVCTDKHCPVHDPQAAAEAAAHPVPTMAPAPETETEEQVAQRQAEFERQRAEYEEEQQRREEERKQQFEKEQAEYEAERNRRAEILKARQTTFERVLESAPPMFTAAQLRVFLRALCNLDPYTFTDEVVEHFAGEDENHQQTPEEILAVAIGEVPDEKLTCFALRLALTGYVDIPRESDIDFLAEAEAAFILPKSGRDRKARKAPTPIKASPKKAATRKKVAA